MLAEETGLCSFFLKCFSIAIVVTREFVLQEKLDVSVHLLGCSELNDKKSEMSYILIRLIMC